MIKPKPINPIFWAKYVSNKFTTGAIKKGMASTGLNTMGRPKITGSLMEPELFIKKWNITKLDKNEVPLSFNRIRKST